MSSLKYEVTITMIYDSAEGEEKYHREEEIYTQTVENLAVENVILAVNGIESIVESIKPYNHE